MLLFALAATDLHLNALVFDALTKVVGHIGWPDRLQHLVHHRLAHVHKHVSIREALHRTNGRRGAGMAVYTAGRHHLTTKVVFQHLLERGGCNAIVVKFEPVAVGLRFDQSKVMTTVQVARVNKHAMQFVYPRLVLGFLD